MEALYPGCTTKLGKPTQPPSVSGKVLERKHHTMFNIYSSTPATHSVSPVLPQQNFNPISSHNSRSATMPSRIRRTPQQPQTPSVYSQHPQTPSVCSQHPQTPSVYSQHPQTPSVCSQYPQTPSVYSQHPQTPSVCSQYPQTPSVNSQQKTSPVYPQQLPYSSGHATMTSYVNMVPSQYSQASYVPPEQLSSTPQLPCSRTSSLPPSFNRLSLQDHISSGKLYCY